MTGQREKERAELLGKNVQSVRTQFDLTVQGLAAGIDISVNHLRLIESGKSNITVRTAGRIADFFDLDISHLFAPKLPKLKKAENIPALKKFYVENANNSQFFISRKGENSVAHFLRNELLPRQYFRKEREVGEVVKECLVRYHKRFNSKEISRELSRLAEKGILSRKDKTGTGHKFVYREPEL